MKQVSYDYMGLKSLELTGDAKCGQVTTLFLTQTSDTHQVRGRVLLFIPTQHAMTCRHTMKKILSPRQSVSKTSNNTPFISMK